MGVKKMNGKDKTKLKGNELEEPKLYFERK
jgi:hypothetical protein